MAVIKIWCLLIDHEKKAAFGDAFSINVPHDASVDDLKKKIKEEQPDVLGHVAPRALAVWRCMNPTLLAEVNRAQLQKGLNNVDFTDETKAERLGVGQEIRSLRLFRGEILLIEVPDLNALHYSVSDINAFDGKTCRREDTVSAIWKRLIGIEDKLILVRGTPGSGKTTLAQLLQSYIRTVEPSRHVIFVHSWPMDHNDPRWSWSRYLAGEGWVRGRETIFIFDEAQMTYADDKLWLQFFKGLRLLDARAVLFASYGSASSRIQFNGSPVDIPSRSKITLRPVDHNDWLPSVGILFTEKEYWDLIQLQYDGSSHFDETFFRNVFKVTGGHIGAIIGFIQVVMNDISYKDCDRTNAQYTWITFRQVFSTDEFMRRLTHTSGVFTRGLPLDKDVQEYTKSSALSAVVDRFPLTADMVKKDIQKGLDQCVKRGWLHTDMVRNNDGTESVGYFFASSLHQWFVEWKLFSCRASPIPVQTNLLEFVLGIIRLFDPVILSEERRIGPACIQRPPEAQYQDEFYRCSYKYSSGSCLSFPEFGTAEGRVDFYVPSKKWGIELLRDGNQLEEHSGRFLQTGSYGRTLEIDEFIVLDFRSSRPQLAHPHLQNLYHVVFEDVYKVVVVLDNKLEEVPRSRVRLLKGAD
ncbi:hypothetical protein ACEPAI_2463 [Sanghuangporus weigelae]